MRNTKYNRYLNHALQETHDPAHHGTDRGEAMEPSNCVYGYGEGISTCLVPLSRGTEIHLTSAASPTHPASPKPRSNRPLLWGLGGTLLSGLGFVGLALFEQYNGMLSELRADLKHFNETSSEYVKKDSLQRIREHFRDCMKELHEIDAAKGRVEQELRASEKARDELAQ